MIYSVKQSNIKSLKKFYDEVYGKSHILKNSFHFQWQFKKNPFLRNDEISIIVDERNDKIISHLGCIPFKLKIFNSTKKGIWHVSFFTLNEYRGKGLGLRLVKFSNKQFDFAMVLSGSEGTESIYHKIGGFTLGNLKRYVCITQKSKIENFIKAEIPIVPDVSKYQTKCNLKRIRKLNGDYDRFWNEVKERYPITTERDRKYVNWRYLKHPLIDYHFLDLEYDNIMVGFAVIRFELKNKEIKAARIVDMIVKKDFEEELIFFIKKYCERKTHFIDFFCTGNFYFRALKKFGFFNNKLSIKIPTVFNPIDKNRRHHINFLYSDLKKSINHKILENENNWYFVKADSDQDRAY